MSGEFLVVSTVRKPKASPASTEAAPAAQATDLHEAAVEDKDGVPEPAASATPTIATAARQATPRRAKARQPMPEASIDTTEELPYSTPDYWQRACMHLMARDRVMRRLIPQLGDACLRTRGDAFTTLARSIIGQQISIKAAQSVWNRFSALLPVTSAPAVLRLKVDDMRAAGLSARKVEYIVDLALHFDSNAVHANAWQTMDDESIIAELVKIRGIGRWTAEMFLIFHLMRPDVLPLDDLGLINGISKNYFSGDPVSRSDAREVAAAWAPYRSVATWYIWRSLEPKPVEY